MVTFEEFKKMRLKFDDLRQIYPQDEDQMKGIRRDYSLFCYVKRTVNDTSAHLIKDVHGVEKKVNFPKSTVNKGCAK